MVPRGDLLLFSVAVTSVDECNETLAVVFVSRSTQIKTYSWDNAQVILAGNKCDMEEERVVSVESGRLLAEQLGESISPISCVHLTQYRGVILPLGSFI